MSEESIFREVDEAVRQDELKKLWDRHGWLMLGAAAAIVVGVAGYKGWVYWQTKQASEAGARFVGALKLAEDDETADARQAFEDLVADGPSGYRVLARFQLAAVMADQGEKAKALETYEALAANSAVDQLFRDFAHIQVATLGLDGASFKDVRAKMEPLLAASNPWRYSARELMGLAAYREGNAKDAQDNYTQLISDPEAPPNLKRRAEMMLALIVKADASAATKQ